MDLGKGYRRVGGDKPTTLICRDFRRDGRPESMIGVVPAV